MENHEEEVEVKDPPMREGDVMVRSQAVKEFRMLCEFAGVDMERFEEYALAPPDSSNDEDDDEDDDDHEFFEKHVRYIQRGLTVVGEDGQGAYKLQRPLGDIKTVIFEEPCGRHYAKAQTKKKGQGITAIMNFMAELIGITPALMKSMKKRDLDVMLAYGRLFLG